MRSTISSVAASAVLGLVVAGGAALAACTDFAGPIPGTEQTTTASNTPDTPPANGSDPNTGSAAGSGEGSNTESGGSSSPSAEELVSFDRDVHPILVDKCGSCHEPSAAPLPGHGAADPDEAFAATQEMSMNEPVYVRILARAAGEGGFMPPGYAGCEEELGAPGCLSLEEYATIELWIEQGASNR